MFYKSISKVYDDIFPQNKSQLDFINNLKPIAKAEVILDIGCATGNLTDLISKCTNNVIGMDLDSDLLKVAKSKYNNLSFIEGNMMDIDKIFTHEYFDRIISFGNTLVHLPNRNNVKSFFHRVYNTLKKDGLFIVQIINYNRIIKNGINELPIIDNDSITFIRDYIIHNGWIDFNTKLKIKGNGEILENSIPLLPLTEEEIRNLIEITGFRNLKFYGNLKGASLTDNSIPLLFSCIK
ncbi:class I SAM-dependent methyltransferase [Thiospirochaeta perfilievii]|uniref:Class I SAM-dependent methyltransferase n=1 Tax=Thiospirochaeta perfilievii TaxID=252967 RepID=A0A5C1Q7X1_9SPIO|nr:class I SAM-dependent methyltransferase [Thiospirochaeta perfilievii]QEN03418.1 class I SAM-dependent methyltransferase [Thiospirochaeta perfilievii]